MKDLKLVTAATLLSLGMTNAFAIGVIDPGGSTSIGTVGGPADGQGTGRSQAPDRTWTPPDMAGCRRASINGELSMGILHGILEPGKEIKVERLPDNQMKVNFPSYVSACLDVKPIYQQVGNNIFVHFKSTKEIKAEDLGMPAGSADFAAMDWEKKYYGCLEHKGYLKKQDNGSYKMDRQKALQDDEIVTGLAHDPFKYEIPDTKDSVEVYVMSPVSTGAGKKNIVKPQSVVGNYPESPRCMEFANPTGKGPSRLYTSARDQVYDRAMNACETENAEKILEELSRLKNSTAGNYNDLVKILESAYDEIQGTRASKIYEEMKEIQSFFKNNKNVTEEAAERNAEKYAELARELSRLVITPNTERIAELMKEDPEAHYDEIQRLGKEIKEYDQLNTSKDFGHMMEKMKEHGLTEEFRAIEGVRLASQYYSRVYDGKVDRKRGEPLSLKDATSAIEDKVEKLDDILFDWDADYASRNGSKAPIYAARARARDRKERMDRDYQRFMRREQSNTQKYCANNMLGMMRNPTRCRSWMNGKNRRMQTMLRRRGRDLSALRRETGRYSQYMTNYNDYLDNLEEENYDYDPYGMYGSSSLYRDYDLYGNADDYSDDFGWNFNMQGPLQPGGQQWRNPAAMSPMMSPQMRPQQQPFMMGPNPYATPFN